MSNLITFQHAYNASARVISTVDKLLDVIINGLMQLLGGHDNENYKWYDQSEF